MTIRTLTCALAAAVMTVGASAQAAAPLSIAPRNGASLENADQLGGGSGFLPVLIFALAVLSVAIFDGDDDNDFPVSP